MCCPDLPDPPDLLDRDPPPRVLLIAGIRWSVSEVSSRYDRRGGTHLLFQCSTLTLAIRHYPPNWRALSDEALWDLAWTQHENSGIW